MRSVSLSALVCSKYSVLASITQISASVISAIWLPVRLRIPAKMDVWFSRRNVQKAMVKTRPRYLARSPVSILSATKFIRRPPNRDKQTPHREHPTAPVPDLPDPPKAHSPGLFLEEFRTCDTQGPIIRLPSPGQSRMRPRSPELLSSESSSPSFYYRR